VAEVAPGSITDWFGRYLPSTLVLGDPASRDAAVHAIQACIPHSTLLPIGVERLHLYTSKITGPLLVCARERRREGDLFIYDMDVTAEDGVIRERWEGLQLRKVSDRMPQASWQVALLGPYLERRIGELFPRVVISVAVMQKSVVQTEPSFRQGHRDMVRADEGHVTINHLIWTEQAIQQALGTRLLVQRRPDGKPEIIGECQAEVSAAHTGDLTLAVAGLGPIGCDLEPIVTRSPAVWRDLLGPERFGLAEALAKEAGEDQDTAATRVWAASECLKKAGVMLNAPLLLTYITSEGWNILASGLLRIATLKTSVQDVEEPVVLAVLAQGTAADIPGH
jgi:enediyne polyketide synthase